MPLGGLPEALQQWGKRPCQKEGACVSPFLRVPDGIWRLWDKGQCQTHGEGVLGAVVARTKGKQESFQLGGHQDDEHLPHRGPFPTTRTSTMQIQVGAHLYG